MHQRGRTWAAAIAGLVLLVGIAATMAQGAGGSETRRRVYMSAIEYKGGASTVDEAYPPEAVEGTRNLAPLGGGYELEAPDATGRWEVESYRFEPGFLVAKLDERITLEIVGINGALHDISLISPSGASVDLVVTRGRLTRVPFRASELGMWKLVCHTHPPAMTADMLVIR